MGNCNRKLLLPRISRMSTDKQLQILGGTATAQQLQFPKGFCFAVVYPRSSAKSVAKQFILAVAVVYPIKSAKC
jgi:hypothetical protein